MTRGKTMGGLLKGLLQLVAPILIQAGAAAVQSKVDKLTKPKAPG
jgi:hypothetical protein